MLFVGDAPGFVMGAVGEALVGSVEEDRGSRRSGLQRGKLAFKTKNFRITSYHFTCLWHL